MSQKQSTHGDQIVNSPSSTHPDLFLWTLNRLNFLNTCYQVATTIWIQTFPIQQAHSVATSLVTTGSQLAKINIAISRLFSFQCYSSWSFHLTLQLWHDALPGSFGLVKHTDALSYLDVTYRLWNLNAEIQWDHCPKCEQSIHLGIFCISLHPTISDHASDHV